MEQVQELATAAALALSTHNYSHAEELYRRVITMVDSSLDPQSPSELDIAQCFNALADLLDRSDKTEEAEVMRCRARKITALVLNEIDGFPR
jgi:ABC-type oligopeptide transport system substrate-binding subunit